jgi:hypothetical protein
VDAAVAADVVVAAKIGRSVLNLALNRSKLLLNRYTRSLRLRSVQWQKVVQRLPDTRPSFFPENRFRSIATFRRQSRWRSLWEKS